MPRLIGRDYYLGIDPGQNGGATVVGSRGEICTVCSFSKLTEHDLATYFIDVADLYGGASNRLVAGIERVHSMPKQGVASSFKFGMGYGFLRGLLAANCISFTEPTPQAWQKYMNCMSKGDKNVTKAAAQKKWPKWAGKITHSIADSMLIAEYVRLTTK